VFLFQKKKVDNSSQKTPHVQKSESGSKSEVVASPRQVAKRADTTPIVAPVKVAASARPEVSAEPKAPEPVVKEMHGKAEVQPPKVAVAASPPSSTAQQRAIAQVWILTRECVYGRKLWN
jgi:hypothetical protein